jgi:hypothetical protein
VEGKLRRKYDDAFGRGNTGTSFRASDDCQILKGIEEREGFVEFYKARRDMERPMGKGS